MNTAGTETKGALALSVRNLECRRGERMLFAAVSFAVPRGGIVWVRGANGQGKTTLLRTLAGLCAPAGGAIDWAGTSERPNLLYLAHENALKDDLTVAESLRFLVRLSDDAPQQTEIDSALAHFGMAGRRHARVRTLSQGQRRRVALGRLVAARDARTWFLDEPFDALDAAGSEILNALLVGHAQRGGSIVLTSHIPIITDPAPTVVELEAPIAA